MRTGPTLPRPSTLLLIQEKVPRGFERSPALGSRIIAWFLVSFSSLIPSSFLIFFFCIIDFPTFVPLQLQNQSPVWSRHPPRVSDARRFLVLTPLSTPLNPPGPFAHFGWLLTSTLSQQPLLWSFWLLPWFIFSFFSLLVTVVSWEFHYECISSLVSASNDPANPQVLLPSRFLFLLFNLLEHNNRPPWPASFAASTTGS